jgi:hypothetical protein
LLGFFLGHLEIGSSVDSCEFSCDVV